MSRRSVRIEREIRKTKVKDRAEAIAKVAPWRARQLQRVREKERLRKVAA